MRTDATARLIERQQPGSPDTDEVPGETVAPLRNDAQEASLTADSEHPFASVKLTPMALSDRDMRHHARAAIQAQARLHQLTATPGFRAMAQQAAEAQERLRLVAETPSFKTMTSRIAEMQPRLQQLTATPGFRAMAQQVAEAQERLRQIATPSLAGALRMREWLRDWDAKERQILELLAPQGWLISPTTSFAEVHELLALAEADGVEAVEAALIRALGPARCREIIEALYDRPSFSEWEEVLDQALSAHEEGSYALSVPVWLIVFDGIWFAECGVANIFTRVTRKSGSVVRSAFPTAGERLLSALIGVTAVVAENIAHGSHRPLGGLRRHAVMHGLDPTYGTEKASLQGILLLEALHYHLDQRDRP